MTPIPQPSGLGALSASMSIEPGRKTETIQRAQVGSLMGANGNNEPPNKSPKRQTPASGARLKRYALEMWVEIDTGMGVHATPEEDSYSIDFAIDCINRAYPGCTGMYLGVAGHMLALYGKKTNPRAGLLLDQAVTTSKAIANVPTWMGYFATWRVKCISTSEAGEILAGCKRIEKENLRHARYELQQRFSALQVGSSLSTTAQPFQPRVAPQSFREDNAPRSFPAGHGLAGSSPAPGFAPGSPLRRAFPSHHQSSDDDGVSTDTTVTDRTPCRIEPPAVAIAAATLMALAPLGEGIRKRMDFRVRSRFLNSGARKAILMMWPVPSSSGLAASRTIVIIMRIHTSCP